MEVTNLLAFTERKQLREWFEKNHLSEKCCWVACNRSKTPKPDTLPYIEIVEEALCFGWIDSTVKKLSDGRLAQRLSPRPLCPVPEAGRGLLDTLRTREVRLPGGNRRELQAWAGSRGGMDGAASAI